MSAGEFDEKSDEKIEEKATESVNIEIVKNRCASQDQIKMMSDFKFIKQAAPFILLYVITDGKP